MKTDELANHLADIKAAEFATVVYRNQRGELSRYRLLLGSHTESLYKRDLDKLRETQQAWEAKDAIYGDAIRALIDSLETSLAAGIGKREDYAHRERENVSKGVTVDSEGRLYLTGRVLEKQILEPGEERKPVKSRPLTVAKREIERGLSKSQIRTFKIDIDSIRQIRRKGNSIDIEP